MNLSIISNSHYYAGFLSVNSFQFVCFYIEDYWTLTQDSVIFRTLQKYAIRLNSLTLAYPPPHLIKYCWVPPPQMIHTNECNCKDMATQYSSSSLLSIIRQLLSSFLYTIKKKYCAAFCTLSANLSLNFLYNIRITQCSNLYFNPNFWDSDFIGPKICVECMESKLYLTYSFYWPQQFLWPKILLIFFGTTTTQNLLGFSDYIFFSWVE